MPSLEMRLTYSLSAQQFIYRMNCIGIKKQTSNLFELFEEKKQPSKRYA